MEGSQQKPASWLARRWAVRLFFAAYLVLQIAIPLGRLPGANNKPFGWQMYSAVSDHVYRAETAGGETMAVDARDYVVRYRAEVDYRPWLPELICSRVEDAVAVTATKRISGEVDRFPCE